MKSLTYRTTLTPVLDLLPSLIAPKTNRPLYERNWRFIDEKALLPHERDLIDRLTRDYGHGILHV